MCGLWNCLDGHGHQKTTCALGFGRAMVGLLDHWQDSVKSKNIHNSWGQSIYTWKTIYTKWQGLMLTRLIASGEIFFHSFSGKRNWPFWMDRKSKSIHSSQESPSSHPQSFPQQPSNGALPVSSEYLKKKIIICIKHTV